MTRFCSVTEPRWRKAALKTTVLFHMKSLPAFQEGRIRPPSPEAFIVKHVQEVLTFMKRNWTQLENGTADHFNIYFIAILWLLFEDSRCCAPCHSAHVHIYVHIVLDLHLNLANKLLLNTRWQPRCSSVISTHTFLWTNRHSSLGFSSLSHKLTVS